MSITDNAGGHCAAGRSKKMTELESIRDALNRAGPLIFPHWEPACIEYDEVHHPDGLCISDTKVTRSTILGDERVNGWLVGIVVMQYGGPGEPDYDDLIHESEHEHWQHAVRAGLRALSLVRVDDALDRLSHEDNRDG